MKTLANCKIFSVVCVQFSLLICFFHLALPDFTIQGRSKKMFGIKRAVNIGVLMPMSRAVDVGLFCTERLSFITHIHQAQILEFEVNRNITYENEHFLGFILLDDCSSEIHSIAQTLSFVPTPNCLNDTLTTNIAEDYNVVGVIGGTRNSQAITLSHIMGRLQIPFISHRAMNQEIENEKTHPYFVPILPTFSVQFKAITALLSELRWTYVSVVFQEGIYGENGLTLLREHLRSTGKCPAAVVKLSFPFTEEQINMTVLELLKSKNARAVVVIAEKTTAKGIVWAASLLSPGTFIWIGTSAWSEEILGRKDLDQNFFGSILVMPSQFSEQSQYKQYFQQLKPDLHPLMVNRPLGNIKVQRVVQQFTLPSATGCALMTHHATSNAFCHQANTSNPWFHEMWEDFFNCSINQTNAGTKPVCDPNLTLPDISIPNYVSRISHSVNLFRAAIVDILETCKVVDPKLFRGCIDSGELLKLLKTKYSPESNRSRKLEFYQVIRATEEEAKMSGLNYSVHLVASLEPLSENLTFSSNFTWEYHWVSRNQTTPESRCSWPCKPREASLPQEVRCCWICQLCRINEHLASNQMRCELCPRYTWPDPDTNFTTCKDITADVPDSRNPRWVVQNLLVSISLICCLELFVFFVRHRKKKIIQDSSLVLHFLILLSLLLGNATIVLFQLRPGDGICKANYFLFSFSLTLMYGPLLIRSICIFITFITDQEKNPFQRIRDESHQMLLCFGLLLIQGLICSVVIIQPSTWHKLTMQELLVNYVELSCDMEGVSLNSTLIYNIGLIIVCGILIFKTRDLEDNFKESGYIALCTSIIIVIWLALIPAYVVASQEQLKTSVLAMAITLNQAVVIVFLFFRKVYVVLYFSEDHFVSKTVFYSGASGSVASVVLTGKAEESVHKTTSIGQISSAVDEVR